MKTRFISTTTCLPLLATLIVMFLSNDLRGAAVPTAVPLQNATATFSQASGWNVSTAIDGVINNFAGWAIDSFVGPNTTTPQTAVFETVANAGFPGGGLLTFRLYQINHNPQHTLGRFRLSATTDDRSTFADGLQSGGDVTANWFVLAPLTAMATDGAILTAQADGSILAGGISPITSTYTITAMTSLQNITGFRLEALEDPSLPFSGPGRYPANGNFVLSEFQVEFLPVPEPSTLAFIGCAALLIFGLRSLRAGRNPSTGA
jgi:hypothetical protein